MEAKSIYGHSAKILADSISPLRVRLTTFEVVLPRIVLSELLMHRVFSRSSASSRAVPVTKMIDHVLANPYVPSTWGQNQKGMVANSEVDKSTAFQAEVEWLHARDQAVAKVRVLKDLGIHKQLANRLLEPWLWHTIIITATEWDNFFHLRNHEEAHPDIQIPAKLMQQIYYSVQPEEVEYNGWHLPLVHDEDWEIVKKLDSNTDRQLEFMVRVSCARCARVSYLTHAGKRDLQADLALYDRLVDKGHCGALEHVARPSSGEGYCGNLRGWVQQRKTIPGESDILGFRESA